MSSPVCDKCCHQVKVTAVHLQCIVLTLFYAFLFEPLMPCLPSSIFRSSPSTPATMESASPSSLSLSHGRLSLSHLPEEVVAKIFSHLVHPSNPRHLYHLKHAILFALNSPHHFSLYQSFFDRISFPYITRYYGQIADPRFLAWLITLISDTIRHVALPEIDSDPGFRAMNTSCTNLVSLSFFDSNPREMHLFPELLIRCSALKSLTIYRIDSGTLLQLQHKSVSSRLNNLTILSLHHISTEQDHDVFMVLLSLSRNLESITLSGKSPRSSSWCVLFEKLENKFEQFSNLETLHLMQFPYDDLRKHQGGPGYGSINVRSVMQYLPTCFEYNAVHTLKNIRITCAKFTFSNVSSFFQRIRFGRITVDIPGRFCITSSPEIAITSLYSAALSSDFLVEFSELLQLREVDLGGFQYNEMVAERLGRITINTPFPNSVLKDVKKVSIIVPFIRKIQNLSIHLDVIESMIPLFPQLESFEMSIHALFKWDRDRIRRIMRLVDAKKPRVIILYMENLLVPYYAIQCPFGGLRIEISERRLQQLSEFITLLKSMESVKEVVMEGMSDPHETQECLKHMAKQTVSLCEEGLNRRRKIVMKLLDELTDMEIRRDMDLTSVIGWFEGMVPGWRKRQSPQPHNVVTKSICDLYRS